MRGERLVSVSSDDGVKLDIKIDGEKHEIRPGIVDILRMKAIFEAEDVVPNTPVTDAQMPAIVEGLLKHLSKPHTDRILALPPAAQMKVASELLRIFNETLGVDEQEVPGPDPISAFSASPEVPALVSTPSSGGAGDGSEPSSEA